MDTDTSPGNAQRARPLPEFPALAQAAATLLRTPTALGELTADDALCVASYMWAVAYNAGATVMQAGESQHTGFMLLLLSGEVSVETQGTEASVISVIGAGSLIGEMGLIDGAPRSTNCLAVSRVEAGALTRAGLNKLIGEHPAVGARLMVAIAQRMAERLRAAGEQLHMVTQLLGDQQAEIARLKR